MSDAVKEAALRELERRIGSAAHAAKEVLAHISPVSPLYLAYISTLTEQVVAKALMSKLQPRVHRLSNPYRNRDPTPHHSPNPKPKPHPHPAPSQAGGAPLGRQDSGHAAHPN